MDSTELEAYVRQQLQAGIGPDSIRIQLVKMGWQMDPIDAVFAKIGTPTSVTPSIPAPIPETPAAPPPPEESPQVPPMTPVAPSIPEIAPDATQTGPAAEAPVEPPVPAPASAPLAPPPPPRPAPPLIHNAIPSLIPAMVVAPGVSSNINGMTPAEKIYLRPLPQRSSLWIWTTLWLTASFDTLIFNILYRYVTPLIALLPKVLSLIISVLAPLALLALASLLAAKYVIKRSIVPRSEAARYARLAITIPTITLVLVVGFAGYVAYTLHQLPLVIGVAGMSLTSLALMYGIIRNHLEIYGD